MLRQLLIFDGMFALVFALCVLVLFGRRDLFGPPGKLIREYFYVQRHMLIVFGTMWTLVSLVFDPLVGTACLTIGAFAGVIILVYFLFSPGKWVPANDNPESHRLADQMNRPEPTLFAIMIKKWIVPSFLWIPASLIVATIWVAAGGVSVWVVQGRG